jgi:hypothetical protein
MRNLCRTRPTVIPAHRRAAAKRLALGFCIASLGAPALAVSPAPPPAPAYFSPLQNGEDLWRACSGSLAGAAPDPCWAYIAGVADAGLIEPGRAPERYCLPGDVRADELTDIVRRYLAEHLGSRRQPAAGAVRDALARSFPCGAAETR